MNYERIIALLPDYLQHGENLNKIFKIVSEMYDELFLIFLKIEQSRGIEEAEGVALDIIGDKIVQTRNNMQDEIYRNRLKTKIMQNNSLGYIENINQLANAFLKENYLGLRQAYQFKDLKNEPAKVEISLSANKIEETRLSKTNLILACGTIETGTTTLGNGIQSTLQKKHITKYKPLFIPDLQSAVGIGINVQYRIKNNKDLIKIKQLDTITFKSKINKLTLVENNNITFKNKNIIKIHSKNANYYTQRCLKCGTTCICAIMGILL